MNLSIWTVRRTPWTGDQPDARPLPTQYNRTQKNADTHPCPKRDSNPWSQGSSGRVPQTARPLGQASNGNIFSKHPSWLDFILRSAIQMPNLKFWQWWRYKSRSSRFWHRSVMEAAWSSEMWVFYITVWHHNPDESDNSTQFSYFLFSSRKVRLNNLRPIFSAHDFHVASLSQVSIYHQSFLTWPL
jgi:hypothetical protein